MQQDLVSSGVYTSVSTPSTTFLNYIVEPNINFPQISKIALRSFRRRKAIKVSISVVIIGKGPHYSLQNKVLLTEFTKDTAPEEWLPMWMTESEFRTSCQARITLKKKTGR